MARRSPRPLLLLLVGLSLLLFSTFQLVTVTSISQLGGHYTAHLGFNLTTGWGGPAGSESPHQPASPVKSANPRGGQSVSHVKSASPGQSASYVEPLNPKKPATSKMPEPVRPGSDNVSVQPGAGEASGRHLAPVQPGAGEASGRHLAQDKGQQNKVVIKHKIPPSKPKNPKQRVALVKATSDSKPSPPLPSSLPASSTPSPLSSLWSSLVASLAHSPTPPYYPCPLIPPHLSGRLPLLLSPASPQTLAGELDWVQPGGAWRPHNCSSNNRVAVVVPYRNRSSQLGIFLRNLHPLLRKQQLNYTIFVVNQTDSNTFNRAMLMNVGFQEALLSGNWSCAVFHDVDLLPEDDRNLYSCPEQPRHLSVAVDKFKYRLPYRAIFGGATAVSVDQFRKLNGYSNMFWGWGGEDDDMSKRIQFHGLKITRYPANIGRYTMIKHEQEKTNNLRQAFLASGPRRYTTDGLNSLSYSLVAKTLEPLYTQLAVRLHRSQNSIQKEVEADRRAKTRERQGSPRRPGGHRMARRY